MTRALAVNALNKDDAEEVTWCVIESISSASDTASALVGAAKLLRELYGFDEEDGSGVIANPFFLANGHDGASPRTRKYLTNRKIKSLGSGAVGLAGSIASGTTLVDVGGIVQHGSAIGTTSAHLIGVRAAGATFKKSETVTGWVDAIIAAKAAKLAVRGAGLAGSAIPIPAVGLGTNIATAIAKLGVKLTIGKLIARTSMEIHWRARQETVLGRGIGGNKSGPSGPASAMFYEVFTKRSFTRLFGKYDTETLIGEPGGWIALNDKLMLM